MAAVASTLNDVQFKLNKQPKDGDLDLILMYLENRKKSGGGEIQNHTYDSKTLVLTVIYETESSKQSVLFKKSHTFSDYVLISSLSFPTESIRLSKYIKNTKVLILNNIDSNEELSIVEVYAEHLVPENEIVQIKQSKVMKDTYIVEFKNDFSFENVQKRHSKRSSLHKRVVNVLEAYDTGSYFIENPFDIIQEQLSEKSYFVNIQHLNLYLLCDNESTVNRSIEVLLNLKQLDFSLSNKQHEVIVKHEPLDLPQLTIVKQESKEECQNKPSYVDIKLDDPLFVAILNCKRIFDDLSVTLVRISSVLVKINDSLFRVVHKKGVLTPEEQQQWTEQVTYVLEKFEKIINFAQIKHVGGTKSKAIEENVQMLNSSKQDLHIYFNNPFICMIGYEHSVKYSYNVLTTLQLQAKHQEQQENQQPQTQQIDIEPLISTLFMNCQDLLNDTQKVLQYENAQLKPMQGNPNMLHITQLLANLSDLKWKERVRNVFNTFIMQNVHMHKLQVPADIKSGFLKLIEKYKTTINSRRCHYFLDNEFYFNLLGYSDDVNRMIIMLNEDLKVIQNTQKVKQTPISRQNSESSNSNISSSSDLTIIIEDKHLKCLLIGCMQIRDDLSNRIKGSNAELRLADDNRSVIVAQIKKSNDPKWVGKVNESINSFNKTQVYVHELDPNYFNISLIEKYNSDPLTIKTRGFSYQVNGNKVTFCGYKRSVNKIISYLIEAKDGPQVAAAAVAATVAGATSTGTGKPIVDAKPAEVAIDLDNYMSFTLLECPSIFKKLNEKLSGSNGKLKKNLNNKVVQIVKISAKNSKADKFLRLNSQVLSNFMANNLRIIDYNLSTLPNLSEQLLRKIDVDLANLRLTTCQLKFMHFCDSKNLKLKIIGTPDIVKQPCDYLKQYFENNFKQPAPALVKNTSRTSSTATLNSVSNKSRESSVHSNPQIAQSQEDPNVLEINLIKQPMLPILFKFNQAYLIDFIGKIENIFNGVATCCSVRCIADESIKKPSKMNVKVIYQASLAAAVSVPWKPVVADYIEKYFSMFKLVRLNLDPMFLNLNQALAVNIYLKRLSSNLYEIIGLASDVEDFQNRILIFQNNNNNNYKPSNNQLLNTMSQMSIDDSAFENFSAVVENAGVPPTSSRKRSKRKSDQVFKTNN